MLNGNFSEMQKRNKTNEAHKKSLQNKRGKNRASYIGYSGNSKLKFPKMIESEFKEFKIPNGIYLTALNYDSGLKAPFDNKNTIMEALKIKDINNIDNNKLISINNYDKLVKYRQFY